MPIYLFTYLPIYLYTYMPIEMRRKRKRAVAGRDVHHGGVQGAVGAYLYVSKCIYVCIHIHIHVHINVRALLVIALFSYIY